jgi:hypothetical protein
MADPIEDLARAISPGHALQILTDDRGKISLCVVNEAGHRPSKAPGVAGHNTLASAARAVVVQLDDAPLPGRVHRALDTWRARHDTDLTPPPMEAP